MASVPRAGETRRAIGPILAMCAASRPGAAPPHGARKPGGGLVGEGIRFEDGARMPGARERAGIHALVYLARHRFGCPGLDDYDFAASAPEGVHSPRLDHALDSLGGVAAPGAMEWDGGGGFARLVRGHGGDVEWLSIAALLCMIDDAVRTRGDPPNRGDLLEEARLECGAYAEDRMSSVYDDLCGMGLLGQDVQETRR